MTRRDRRERLEQVAATAWSMAARGDRLEQICLALLTGPMAVWRLLELHQRNRRARR